MRWIAIRNSVLSNYIFSSQLNDTNFKLCDVSFIVTSYKRHLNMSLRFRVIYNKSNFMKPSYGASKLIS
jgi:hypothetical protein